MNPSSGGPMEGIRQVTPHLSSLGFQTTVVSLDPPNSPWLLNQPFNIIGLGPVFSGYGLRLGLPKILQQLALKHDVVIIHGLWQYHALAMWTALRDLNIPFYVYPHGMLDPWFKSAFPFKHLKKSLYWMLVESKVLRDAKCVLFTTQQECLLARQSFLPYQVKEFVVGYGTSIPPFEADMCRQSFLDRFPNLRSKRILLYVGRLHPKKGLDFLLHALAAVVHLDTQLHLVVAGPDSVGLQDSLLKLSRILDISHRISWTGMLSGPEKWGAYYSSELFCLPSHQENFGIVVAEALACGLPVSISNAVNIANYVELYHAGLVHPVSIAGASHALTAWISMSPHERFLMKLNSQRLFAERFEISRIASNLASRLLLD